MSKPFLEGHQSWDGWHEPQVLHVNVSMPCPSMECALGTCQGVAQAMLTPVWLKPYTKSKAFVHVIEGDCWTWAETWVKNICSEYVLDLSSLHLQIHQCYWMYKFQTKSLTNPGCYDVCSRLLRDACWRMCLIFLGHLCTNGNKYQIKGYFWKVSGVSMTSPQLWPSSPGVLIIWRKS